MKNTILFFFLLLAAAVSAQSNSFVTDRLRAAEYLRIGTNTSQKVTGFDKVITAPGTHDSLPTSRAVVDFLEANFTPIGYYTSGTGISISDDVITNTGDLSATNEIQTLSLSGSDLSLSLGGGTVTLPGDGNGIYDGSGNVPPGTSAYLDGEFSLGTENYALYVDRTFNENIEEFLTNVGIRYGGAKIEVFKIDSETESMCVLENRNGDGYSLIQVIPEGFQMTSENPSGQASFSVLANGGATYIDYTSAVLGIQYADDYSTTLKTNARSLADVGTVNILKQTPVSYTNAAAPNNTIFYSTTDSKLSYKDPAGVVHNLY